MNNGHRHWGAFVLLVTDQIPLAQHEVKYDTVKNTEDPSIQLYGVDHSTNRPGNLKTTTASTSPYLLSSEPMTITYDKTQNRVVFSSSKFEFYQSNLPQKDFAISII